MVMVYLLALQVYIILFMHPHFLNHVSLTKLSSNPPTHFFNFWRELSFLKCNVFCFLQITMN